MRHRNPPDHSYCHQCGSWLGVDAGVAVTGSSPALVRRTPDESRLPPPGSFRSGLYRLIRALFVNQKPATSRPLRIPRLVGKRGRTAGGAASGRRRNVDAVDESKRSVTVPAGLDPAVVAAGIESHAGPARVDLATDDGDVATRATGWPQSRGALSRTAMYWLARAFLLRHLLPGREGLPTHPAGASDTDPASERGVPARLPASLVTTAPSVTRPPSGTAGSPDPAEPPGLPVRCPHTDGQQASSAPSGWEISRNLRERATDALHGAAVMAERVRVALTPADAVAVPRYVEVAAVAALTLVALLLRTWDLPGSPAGIHGDETEIGLRGCLKRLAPGQSSQHQPGH